MTCPRCNKDVSALISTLGSGEDKVCTKCWKEQHKQRSENQ